MKADALSLECTKSSPSLIHTQLAQNTAITASCPHGSYDLFFSMHCLAARHNIQSGVCSCEQTKTNAAFILFEKTVFISKKGKKYRKSVKVVGHDNQAQLQCSSRIITLCNRVGLVIMLACAIGLRCYASVLQRHLVLHLCAKAIQSFLTHNRTGMFSQSVMDA